MQERSKYVIVKACQKLVPKQTNNPYVSIFAQSSIDEKLKAWAKKLEGTQIWIPDGKFNQNGPTYYNPETIDPTATIDILLRQLQYFARADSSNTTGFVGTADNQRAGWQQEDVNAAKYDQRINLEDIIAAKSLVQQCLIGGFTKATHYGGFRTPQVQFTEPKDIILIDLAGPQFQQVYNEGTRYFIISEFHDQANQPFSEFDDNILLDITGQKKTKFADETFQTEIAKGTGRYVPVAYAPENKEAGLKEHKEYFDTYAYKEFVANDVVRTGLAINQIATDANVENGKINFKFVAYGTGDFAKPIVANDYKDPRYTQVIQDNLLEGVYQGLEALFTRLPQPNKIGCIELPFYTPLNIPFSPAQAVSARKIRKLCRENGAKVFFGWEDAFKPRVKHEQTGEEYITATTNCGNAHVPFGNEMPGQMNAGVMPEIPSIDAVEGENLQDKGASFSTVANPGMSAKLSPGPSFTNSTEMLLHIWLLKNPGFQSYIETKGTQRADVQTQLDTLIGYWKDVKDEIPFQITYQGTQATARGNRNEIETYLSFGPFADAANQAIAEWIAQIQAPTNEQSAQQWEKGLAAKLAGVSQFYFTNPPTNHDKEGEHARRQQVQDEHRHAVCQHLANGAFAELFRHQARVLIQREIDAYKAKFLEPELNASKLEDEFHQSISKALNTLGDQAVYNLIRFQMAGLRYEMMAEATEEIEQATESYYQALGARRQILASRLSDHQPLEVLNIRGQVVGRVWNALVQMSSFRNGSFNNGLCDNETNKPAAYKKRRQEQGKLINLGGPYGYTLSLQESDQLLAGEIMKGGKYQLIASQAVNEHSNIMTFVDTRVAQGRDVKNEFLQWALHNRDQFGKGYLPIGQDNTQTSNSQFSKIVVSKIKPKDGSPEFLHVNVHFDWPKWNANSPDPNQAARCDQEVRQILAAVKSYAWVCGSNQQTMPYRIEGDFNRPANYQSLCNPQNSQGQYYLDLVNEGQLVGSGPTSLVYNPPTQKMPGRQVMKENDLVLASERVSLRPSAELNQPYTHLRLKAKCKLISKHWEKLCLVSTSLREASTEDFPKFMRLNELSYSQALNAVYQAFTQEEQQSLKQYFNALLNSGISTIRAYQRGKEFLFKPLPADNQVVAGAEEEKSSQPPQEAPPQLPDSHFHQFQSYVTVQPNKTIAQAYAEFQAAAFTMSGGGVIADSEEKKAEQPHVPQQPVIPPQQVQQPQPGQPPKPQPQQFTLQPQPSRSNRGGAAVSLSDAGGRSTPPAQSGIPTKAMPLMIENIPGSRSKLVIFRCCKDQGKSHNFYVTEFVRSAHEIHKCVIKPSKITGVGTDQVSTQIDSQVLALLGDRLGAGDENDLFRTMLQGAGIADIAKNFSQSVRQAGEEKSDEGGVGEVLPDFMPLIISHGKKGNYKHVHFLNKNLEGKVDRSNVDHFIEWAWNKHRITITDNQVGVSGINEDLVYMGVSDQELELLVGLQGPAGVHFGGLMKNVEDYAQGKRSRAPARGGAGEQKDDAGGRGLQPDEFPGSIFFRRSTTSPRVTSAAGNHQKSQA